MDFTNKVVLITGAGKGIGRKLAEKLAERGACIAANDISPLNVEEVVSAVHARGGKAKAFMEDVAKKVGAQTLIKNVEDEFGGLDLLINHAAVKPRASLLAMDEWDWHRTLDVNLTGAFLMTQTAARVMKAKGCGVILNLVAGPADRSGKEAGAFLVSKAGLEELTRQADSELAEFGIHVFSAEAYEDALRILEEL